MTRARSRRRLPPRPGLPGGPLSRPAGEGGQPLFKDGKPIVNVSQRHRVVTRQAGSWAAAKVGKVGKALYDPRREFGCLCG